MIIAAFRHLTMAESTVQLSLLARQTCALCGSTPRELTTFPQGHGEFGSGG